MAIPGILQQIAKSNPLFQNVRRMMGMVNASQNPQAVLNQLVTSNPQLKQVMDLVKQYDGSPEKALIATSKEMGIDPNEIMNMLK